MTQLEKKDEKTLEKKDDENSSTHSLVRASSYYHSFNVARTMSLNSRLFLTVAHTMMLASSTHDGNISKFDHKLRQHLRIYNQLVNTQAAPGVEAMIDVLLDGYIVSKGFMHDLLNMTLSMSTCRKHLNLLHKIGFLEMYDPAFVEREVSDTTIYLGSTKLYGLPKLPQSAYNPLIEWLNEKSINARKRRGFKLTDQSSKELQKKSIKHTVLQENVNEKETNSMKLSPEDQKKVELNRMIKHREDWLSKDWHGQMSPRLIKNRRELFEKELIELRNELRELSSN